MSEQFYVDLEQLEDDAEPLVQIQFSGENTVQAVWITLEVSKRLAARLVEVNEELSIQRKKRPKSAKQ